MSSEQGLRMAASTAEPPPSLSASDGGGRALELGPRVAARVGAVAVALVVCGALLGVFASHHDRSVVADPPARYGGLPSWLPKATVPVGRTVKASAAHPALAIQGDTVAVELAHGRALATAVGPTVPEDGRFPVPATSPCTFIVTFATASGRIPLSARAFTFTDELGHVRHPQVTAMGGGPIPRQVVPGHPISLKVHDIVPTGDGGLTWAPNGRRPIVSWDFDVEID
jgi:hypothetical protein